jgi:hypothetical protein
MQQAYDDGTGNDLVHVGQISEKIFANGNNRR